MLKPWRKESMESLLETNDGQSAADDLLRTEPVFVNLLRHPRIDAQPGGIDSWAP
jgi:hypothetical protein